jgi:hypothetical protein
MKRERGVHKKVRTQVENFGGILMRRRVEEFGHREKRGERTEEIQKRSEIHPEALLISTRYY